MIVIWILINDLEDMTLKYYEQNYLKDNKITKIKGKEETSKPFSKR